MILILGDTHNDDNDQYVDLHIDKIMFRPKIADYLTLYSITLLSWLLQSKAQMVRTRKTRPEAA